MVAEEPVVAEEPGAGQWWRRSQWGWWLRRSLCWPGGASGDGGAVGGFGGGGVRSAEHPGQCPFRRFIGATRSGRTFVADADGETGNEIGGLPGAFGDRGEAEPRVADEYLPVGPEPGAGAGDLLRDATELAQARPPGEAGAGAGLAVVRELAGDAAAEAGRPGVAVPVHLDVQARGQGVDHRGADAVQAAGGRVGAAAELAARVQPGHDQLDAGELGLRLDVDGDAAAVVAHLGGPVGVQDDLDPGAVPGQRLVHRVVEDLPQAVLQPAAVGGADVHPGPFADRVQAFENGKMPGGIGASVSSRRGRRGRSGSGGKGGHGRQISFTGPGGGNRVPWQGSPPRWMLSPGHAGCPGGRTSV